MTNYTWQRRCCTWDHQYLADGREHRASSTKHSGTLAQWSFCMWDRGGGRGGGGDFCWTCHFFPASLSCITCSCREMWSVARPLLTSIWSRFQAMGCLLPGWPPCPGSRESAPAVTAAQRKPNIHFAAASQFETFDWSLLTRGSDVCLGVTPSKGTSLALSLSMASCHNSWVTALQQHNKSGVSSAESSSQQRGKEFGHLLGELVNLTNQRSNSEYVRIVVLIFCASGGICVKYFHTKIKATFKPSKINIFIVSLRRIYIDWPFLHFLFSLLPYVIF